MAMRIRLALGCLAIGAAAAIALTGTAEQAIALSGAHATVSAARLGGGFSAQTSPSPTASFVTAAPPTTVTPSPSAPPTTVTPSPSAPPTTVTPSPSATATATSSPSAVPSGAPNTGGGTGGGSDTPLVAAGAATAVAGAGLALLVFRRWRRDRAA